MLFKEAHHDHISQYLMGSSIYTFISTSTQTVGEGQIQFLDVPYVKPTLCNELCFPQFHAKIHIINKKKKKQEKAYCEVNTLFIGVIIINVYVIIYHWKGQPFIYQVSRTIFFP